MTISHLKCHMTIRHLKCQKDPSCGIFLKRRRNYKNTNTQIYKYTKTAYNKVPERPSMWYIFKKRIVQGYQKLYTGPSVSRFGLVLRNDLWVKFSSIFCVDFLVNKNEKILWFSSPEIAGWSGLQKRLKSLIIKVIMSSTVC